jgi:acetylornithine deacetylase/succinyl-diaminopimelate desuccinylase family protein
MTTPILQTLADLVRINSVNPAYEGGVSERAVAEYLRRFFLERGVETWEQEVFPGRPNLIARIPGRDSRRRVVLEAHTDTVSVKGMSIPPFEPTVTEGRLYGRGACDTKAGLAGMMHALASLKADGFLPPCEVWLAAVVDEEYSFRGVTALCQGLVGEAAIVAEPTEMRLVIASKGVLRWRIHVQGRAAHSSKPQLGVNAITHMARLILALEADHAQLASRPHPLLGPATCNVGVIHGGVQVNFVPDTCCIEIDRRLLPGEAAGGVLSHYQSLIDALSERHAGFVARMDAPMLVDEALSTSPDSLPSQVAGSILRELGLNPEPCGVPFGSDASKLSRQGVASLIFGPGSIDRAHAAVEYVEVEQVAQAFEFYREFIRRFE